MDKWTLNLGCHRGTLTSRDHERPKRFRTREEAVADYLKARSFYHSIGHKVWYAELVSPGGGKEILEQSSYW